MSQPNKRRKLSSASYEATEATSSIHDARRTTKPDQRRSLFVRSLPASVTTERLTAHFSESFPLKHATVAVDTETKISRGFGFVTFADTEDAQAALEHFNNSTLDGRKIKVELAESRQRDAETEGKDKVNTTGVRLRAQRQKSQEDAQPPRLIVRNLPWSIKTSDDLAALFRSYGKVKHAVVPKKNSKVQYGFGIVLLRGRKNAEKALAGVNGKEVDGRTLAVDWAVDKETWEKGQGNEARQTGANEVDVEDPIADGPMAGEEDEVVAEEDEAVNDEDDADDDLEDFEANETLYAPLEESDVDDESDDEGADDVNRNDTTVFVRNLPFTTDDDGLKEHFSTFGAVRYARVVYDQETERSRGTAFVCFFNLDDSKACVRDAPKHEMSNVAVKDDKKKRGDNLRHTVLQNEASDPSGKYTLDGRVLQVTRALSRGGAARRADEASVKREARDRDKRRLYLLSEGSIPRDSKLYEQLGKAETDIRESSARQRQRLIKNSPNLCLSLTRLSVRNLPRGIDSKELKALAREAVVGFASDVKQGIRQPLSKEELRRGGPEMQEAERLRKKTGKGIVRQAKVVFEDKEGSKVKDGGGRSRGYGFIEYVSHRNALAGLRWLNGHMVSAQNSAGERRKRLIVEFAIENAQVIQRRTERERKAQNDRKAKPNRKQEKPAATPRNGKKRKRDDNGKAETAEGVRDKAKPQDPEERNNLAKRNRIIAKKRQARKTRKG
jgi:nucleolar protein 4